MWMQEGGSHVNTYTTKDELDNVEGGGGGGVVWEEEHLHAFTSTTKAKWNGMEGGGDCEPSNTFVTANL